MFKPEAKTVFSVDYNEIEALIDEHYGEAAGFNDSYEIPCLEERGNDEDWEVTIKKEVLDTYDQEHLTPDDGRYRQWSTRIFMTDLCNRDLIPDGTYLISISW